MDNAEKVVIRFMDGMMLKGIVKNFSVATDEIHFEEAGSGITHDVPFADLKAVFFVKSLEGDPAHREKKLFSARKDPDHAWRKIFIKFKDGENLYGFLKGEVPWKQGFFVAEPQTAARGFFVIPTDEESNNIKIFVVGSSIKDITSIVP